MGVSSATSTSTSPTKSSPPASLSTSATATPRTTRTTPRPGERHGQYSKYLQHNGNDVIELYHGKDLIYTIGGRGYDKTFAKDKTCLRTGDGEWPKAWDCSYKANTVPSSSKMKQPLGCAQF